MGITCCGGGGSGAQWWECHGRKQDADVAMNCSIPDLGGCRPSGYKVGILGMVRVSDSAVIQDMIQDVIHNHELL